MLHVYVPPTLPDPGDIPDLDDLAPTMAEDADEYGEQPEYASKAPGTVTLESKEFSRMLDVLGGVHAFLEDGKPLAVLERSYRAYTSFCEGVPTANAERRKNDITAQVSKLRRALRAAGPFIREMDYDKSLQRTWDTVERVAADVESRLSKLLEA